MKAIALKYHIQNYLKVNLIGHMLTTNPPYSKVTFSPRIPKYCIHF